MVGLTLFGSIIMPRKKKRGGGEVKKNYHNMYASNTPEQWSWLQHIKHLLCHWTECKSYFSFLKIKRKKRWTSPKWFNILYALRILQPWKRCRSMTGFGDFILLQQLKKSNFNTDIIVRHVFAWWLTTASIRVLVNMFLAVVCMHRFQFEWAVLHVHICFSLCLCIIC